MTESIPLGFTQQTATIGTPQKELPAWIKYATIAALGLAGVMWLLPQYKFIGEEWHIYLEYYEYHNLGTQGAGAGYILFAWIFLIAAAASVLYMDKPDQPLGRINWIPIPLIVVAMGVVLAGQSTLEDTVWTVPDDKNYTGLYWDPTAERNVVWIALLIGLVGAIGALVYLRFYTPNTRPLAGPSVQRPAGPAPHPPASSPRSPEPQQPEPAPKSTLEQKLDEYDRLHAAGKISDEERAALRLGALSGQ